MGGSGAENICQEVKSALQRFAEIAVANEVPAADIHRFERDIARRCRSER